MSKTAPKTVMPIIAVDSVDETRNFYVERLGFEHVMGVLGKDGQLEFVTVVRDGARIMFARGSARAGSGKGAGGKQPVELYVQVADVEGYHAAVTKKGVRVSDPLTMQWWGDRTFKVLDPNGYEIWFFETAAEPKPPKGLQLV